MRRPPYIILAIGVALALSACGDDDSTPSPDAGVDAVVQQDAAVDAAPDAAATGCTLEPRDFWVYDLSVMPPTWAQVPATCRAQGTHGIVYVADDIWETDMDQQDVDGVLDAFDNATPADASRGIFEINTTAFGEPTDVDGNDRVILFYSELPGYGSYQFDGYIRQEDFLNPSDAHSNGAEMVYLDGVRNDPTGEYMHVVVAHEFEHVIHKNYDLNERSWVDETLAEAAMILCGYLGDLDGWVASDFAQHTTTTLTSDEPSDQQYHTSFNYGAGFLFGAYLLERFGQDFITTLVEQQTDGISGIESALSAEGYTETFRRLLGDWAMANFLDAPTLTGGPWGYTAFDVPAMAAVNRTVPASLNADTIEPHSARYYVYELSVAAGSTLEVTLTADQWADLEIRYAIYADGDTSSAQVASWTMTAQTDVLTVDNVGGADDRVVVSVVQADRLAQAVVDMSAAHP